MHIIGSVTEMILTKPEPVVVGYGVDDLFGFVGVEHGSAVKRRHHLPELLNVLYPTVLAFLWGTIWIFTGDR